MWFALVALILALAAALGLAFYPDFYSGVSGSGSSSGVTTQQSEHGHFLAIPVVLAALETEGEDRPPPLLVVTIR